MNNDHPGIEDLYLRVEDSPEVRVQVCLECGVLLPPEEYFFDNPTRYFEIHEKFHDFLARGSDEE